MRRDIDIIAEKVRSELPQVLMEQLKAVHPSGDDWLWWFKLPGIGKNIHLESINGQCPFRVEHDDMPSPKHAIKANNREDAAKLVLTYLKKLKSTDHVFK